MDENDTTVTNFETPKTDNDKNNSNVILFSDYTPSDILGIVRVLPIQQSKNLTVWEWWWTTDGDVSDLKLATVGDRILVLSDH